VSGGESGRILIVDDDEAARYVKSRLLRCQGYAVSEASLGRDALALADRPADLERFRRRCRPHPDA
jgi:CheY-like chemotaxis protein